MRELWQLASVTIFSLEKIGGQVVFTLKSRDEQSLVHYFWTYDTIITIILYCSNVVVYVLCRTTSSFISLIQAVFNFFSLILLNISVYANMFLTIRLLFSAAISIFIPSICFYYEMLPRSLQRKRVSLWPLTPDSRTWDRER